MKKKYNIIILIFIFPLLLASCSKEKRKPASFMAGDYSGTLYLESDTLVNYLVTVIEVSKKEINVISSNFNKNNISVTKAIIGSHIEESNHNVNDSTRFYISTSGNNLNFKKIINFETKIEFNGEKLD